MTSRCRTMSTPTMSSTRASLRTASRVTWVTGSPNSLARRYGLGSPQLTRILRRINVEGWIERLPGYGWEFQPVLTSLQAYRDSCRFRLLLEPAAIMEPGFAVDRRVLIEVRAQQ